MSDKHQTPSYPLRIPAELRARLEDEAKKHKRSLNAEIAARLEKSFNQALSAEEAQEQFDEILFVLRHFEGTLNRGFNQLASVVYDTARKEHSRAAHTPPPRPYTTTPLDTPISELMEQARKDGELDE